MASRKELAAWIIENKDKAGTPEFEQIATAFKVMAAGGLDQYAEQQVGPAKPQPNPMTINAQGQPRSATEQIRIGAGYGLNKLRRGLSQAVGLTSQAEVDQLEQRDRPIEESGLGRLGMVGSSMAAGGPLGLIRGAGTYLGSALIGGGLGAAQPTETGEDTGYNALAGALAGAGGRALFGAGGGGMNPKPNPKAEALMKQGVRVPPGAMFGGIAQRAEEKATSWPITGDAITAAKKRAIEDWNNLVINRYITGPLGVKVNGSGYKAVETAYKTVSKTYDNVLSRMAVKLDQKALNAMTNVNRLVKGGLPPEQRATFQSVLDSQGIKISPAGGMTGKAFKSLTSVLREKAAAYGKSEKVDEQSLGKAFEEMHRQLMSLAARQNPQYAPMLYKANNAYAHLLRVERAAAMTGSRGGIFSPEALNMSSKALDRSLRKRSYSHGNALLQRPSQDAIEVLGRQYPDSGTAGRMALMLGTGSGFGGAGAMGIPGAMEIAALHGVAAAPYAAAAHPLARALLTQRTPAMRQFGQQFANRAYPYAGVAAAPFAKRDEK